MLLSGVIVQNIIFISFLSNLLPLCVRYGTVWSIMYLDIILPSFLIKWINEIHYYYCCFCTCCFDCLFFVKFLTRTQKRTFPSWTVSWRCSLLRCLWIRRWFCYYCWLCSWDILLLWNCRKCTCSTNVRMCCKLNVDILGMTVFELNRLSAQFNWRTDGQTDGHTDDPIEQIKENRGIKSQQQLQATHTFTVDSGQYPQ